MVAVDYYALLSLPRTASTMQVKTAYHKTLLECHPDKQQRWRLKANSGSSRNFDMARIKEAYETLSSPSLRSQYDQKIEEERQRVQGQGRRHQRPAQVVSLEEFCVIQDDVGNGDDGCCRWEYPCRCGGRYGIEESDMDAGVHLVSCSHCSEVIWVGYELASSEDGDEEL